MVPQLRAPIVLVHGLLGFDRLQVGAWTVASYFCDIPEFLQAAGNRVLLARLSPTGGIADRARQLARFLDEEAPHTPVHLFAHSMGGLDSRYLISGLGLAERVLTLTTVGTPHHGTAFADWGVHRIGRLLRPVLDEIGLPYQAFYDLTTASCRAFNEECRDAPGVRYFSIAGKHEGGSWLHAEWEIPHRIVLLKEGPNDGVVSVASAKWGESCAVWEGDHVSLVNWANPLAAIRGQNLDRPAEYAAHLQRLVEAGY